MVAVSSWVDLDGPTYVVDHGGPPDGPMLVCVHGLGGSHVNWAALAPLLTARCRVVALDLAGHGRTRPGRRSTAVEANQRLLDRFLREVIGTPAVLVGNSMGATVSILQATAFPATVAGLVLVDPPLPQTRGSRPDPMVTASFLAYALPGLGRVVLAGRRRRLRPEQAVAQVLRLCCVDPSRVPADLVEASVELARERAGYPGVDAAFLGAARSLMRLLARPGSYHARMRALDGPVLLLHGDRDRLVPFASARQAALDNPGWRFEVAHDVGHVPQLEAPSWTADMILDWLAAEGAPAAAASAGHRPTPPAARHKGAPWTG